MNNASRVRSLSLVLLLLGISVGCESVTTKSDYDKSFDFGGYHTFSWISENPMTPTTAMPIPVTQGRIQLAIIDVLKQKGFLYSAERAKADFVVAFTAGTRQKVRVDTTNYPVAFRGPYTWGTGYYQDIDVREYNQGRLAIDVFDNKLRQPVWHGYGTKSVTGSDQDNPERVIHKAVEAILKDFPPGKKM